MEPRECSTCDHWVENTENEGPKTGKCRRFPPHHTHGTVYKFPLTSSSDCCGEYQNVMEKPSSSP